MLPGLRHGVSARSIPENLTIRRLLQSLYKPLPVSIRLSPGRFDTMITYVYDWLTITHTDVQSERFVLNLWMLIQVLTHCLWAARKIHCLVPDNS